MATAASVGANVSTLGILGGALVGGGFGVAVDNANGNCYSLSALKVIGVYDEHEGIPEETRRIHIKAAQRQITILVEGMAGQLSVH